MRYRCISVLEEYICTQDRMIVYPLRETCLGSPGQNVKIFTPKARGLRPLGSGSRGPLWTPIARALVKLPSLFPEIRHSRVLQANLVVHFLRQKFTQNKSDSL